MIRALAFVCLAGAAQAETPMTGTEFEAYVTGKTLTFGTPLSEFYGAEQYLPNRRVIWQEGLGLCIEGVWYDDGPNICFLYENDPEPKCWAVYQTPTGIRAEFLNTPGSAPIFESTAGEQGLICPGPDLLS